MTALLKAKEKRKDSSEKSEKGPCADALERFYKRREECAYGKRKQEVKESLEKLFLKNLSYLLVSLRDEEVLKARAIEARRSDEHAEGMILLQVIGKLGEADFICHKHEFAPPPDWETYYTEDPLCLLLEDPVFGKGWMVKEEEDQKVYSLLLKPLY